MKALLALRRHWPEYFMEAAELGLFMISACVVVAALEHPSSFLHAAIPSATLRRVLAGMAMGLTAIAIIYSPWGKRSGAHFNPAVTLTYWRLGKIDPVDALFYGAFQAAGAVAGVAVSVALLGSEVIGDASVNYVATLPGTHGTLAAFGGEAAISFGLMSLVLFATNDERVAPFTGLLAGTLVAIYIAVEAPISGMSMNPARSLGPAVVGDVWAALWVYFAAPPLGMLAAAELRRLNAWRIDCAKLDHQTHYRCIFCDYQHGG
jgi:aquaporin Z